MKSYARSDLDRVTVAPRPKHEVMALQGRVVPYAEAHERPGMAAARRKLLHAAQAVGDTGTRQMLGCGDALAEQPTDVIRGTADRARGRVGESFAQRSARRIVVGDGVDVLPAAVAVAPGSMYRAVT